MLKRKIRNLAIASITIAAATLLTLSTASVSAMTASAAPGHSAATTMAAEVSRSASTARPASAATTCYLLPGSAIFFNSSCNFLASKTCVGGNQGFIDGAVSPRYFANGCSQRVWLYTGTNRTGNNLCVTRRTLDGYLHQNYIWFWVSVNSIPC